MRTGSYIMIAMHMFRSPATMLVWDEDYLLIIIHVLRHMLLTDTLLRDELMLWLELLLQLKLQMGILNFVEVPVTSI